jgi:Tfp pilus assembly protein PilO
MMTQAVDLIKRNARIVVLIVIIIALAVVAFMMYSGWSSATDQKKDLEAEQLRARTNLNIALDQYNVDKLRAEYQTLSLGPRFPSSLPVVDLSAYIAAAADRYNVSIVSLTPGATGSETIGGKTYKRYNITVEIAASYERMNSMLRYLEEGPFSTLRIEGVNMTRTDGKFTIVLVTL